MMLCRILEEYKRRAAVRAFPEERHPILAYLFLVAIHAAANLDRRIAITRIAFEVVAKLAVLDGQLIAAAATAGRRIRGAAAGG